MEAINNTLMEKCIIINLVSYIFPVSICEL